MQNKSEIRKEKKIFVSYTAVNSLQAPFSGKFGDVEKIKTLSAM